MFTLFIIQNGDISTLSDIETAVVKVEHITYEDAMYIMSIFLKAPDTDVVIRKECDSECQTGS